MVRRHGNREWLERSRGRSPDEPKCCITGAVRFGFNLRIRRSLDGIRRFSSDISGFQADSHMADSLTRRVIVAGWPSVFSWVRGSHPWWSNLFEKRHTPCGCWRAAFPIAFPRSIRCRRERSPNRQSRNWMQQFARTNQFRPGAHNLQATMKLPSSNDVAE